MVIVVTNMSYKLHYFNGRGRAELIRLVFAQAGQKFEDIRVEKDKWPALKPNAPFGAMPYLEMDGGVKLCQSAAIARFLARKFGLAGKTDLEQAQADMFIDCYEDTVKPMFSFFFEPDEAKKGELKKKFIEEQLPKSLAGLESLLKANKGGDGFCVGDGVTWADLGFLYMSGWLSMAGADTQLAKYPKLNALREKVSKLPKVAEWLEKRPKTDF